MDTSSLTSSLDRFYDAIRDVPDFPEKGIVFKDITPLLHSAELFSAATKAMIEGVAARNVDKVLAIESRGFLFGGPMAQALGAGLVLARKAGKLPWERRRVEYQLEYGTDAIEIHADSVAEGEQVLIVDDVLATGGTARAAAQIVAESGGVVCGFTFLLELGFLDGRHQLPQAPINSLLVYPR